MCVDAVWVRCLGSRSRVGVASRVCCRADKDVGVELAKSITWCETLSSQTVQGGEGRRSNTLCPGAVWETDGATFDLDMSLLFPNTAGILGCPACVERNAVYLSWHWVFWWRKAA